MASIPFERHAKEYHFRRFSNFLYFYDISTAASVNNRPLLPEPSATRVFFKYIVIFTSALLPFPNIAAGVLDIRMYVNLQAHQFILKPTDFYRPLRRCHFILSLCCVIAVPPTAETATVIRGCCSARHCRVKGTHCRVRIASSGTHTDAKPSAHSSSMPVPYAA